MTNDFLLELFTEELPAKLLPGLADQLRQHIQQRLEKADLRFTNIETFATPRRIAILVKDLIAETPAQYIERKGPALSAAYDKDGKPSSACLGFARSCGVEVSALQIIKTAQGEWVGLQQEVPGKRTLEILPDLVNATLQALALPKRMRWGASDTQFIRPVHHVVMLYGSIVVPATILGCTTSNITYGHRFLAPQAITLTQASDYEAALEKHFVIANFAKRRERIQEQITHLLKDGAPLISSLAFLDEVTGLVEWPEALCGNFDASFLELPQEVLISSMQDHQRYFPVVNNAGELRPQFITISNIRSRDPARVTHGNERVLRARLADAAFFYNSDKKENLFARLDRLRGITFQAKLGTLYDKAERMSQLATYIAEKVDGNKVDAARAALLAKADLTTQMVNEFPELQGIMGGYYAEHDGEPKNVSAAIKEHYYPRFAGDAIPRQLTAQIVALADRIDTLVGMFGIGLIPTGDKDPYGLRRAALSILRIVIGGKLNLDLKEVMVFAFNAYGTVLKDPTCVQTALTFIQERLRAWYQEQGIPADVFAAVAALNISNPLDIDARIHAVQTFKQLPAAEMLSIANKRVSNILSKYADKLELHAVNPNYFEHQAEQVLATQLDNARVAITPLHVSHQYDQELMRLAELREPIDDFFEHVMVMTEDKQRRENRLLLLTELRTLFSQVADIALLQ